MQLKKTFNKIQNVEVEHESPPHGVIGRKKALLRVNTPGGVSDFHIPMTKGSMKKVMNIVDDVKIDDKKQRFNELHSQSMIMRDIYTDDKQKKREYSQKETNLPQINIPDDTATVN